MRFVITLFMFVCACNLKSEIPDAPAAMVCEPTAAFGAPVAIAGFATGGGSSSPRLSWDERTLYFVKSASAGDSDLYVAQRGSTTESFGAATPLTSLNSAAHDDGPTVSRDELTIIFASNRVVGEGSRLYIATRSSTLAAFGTPELLGGVGSAMVTEKDGYPNFALNDQELWFASTRVGSLGQYDLLRAARSGSGFANPSAIPALESAGTDEWPVVSVDGLTVYFTSSRPGDAGGYDIWTAHRSTLADGFPTPRPVSEVNSGGSELAGWLSVDNCRLYFASNRTGTYDLYIATRRP